jgi:hypothetical protein
MASLGHPDAHELALERGPRGREIRALVGSRLEGALGIPTSLLGSLEVDLRGEVGALGHHDDLVRQDLDEAAEDGERFLGPSCRMRSSPAPSVAMSGA